MAWLKARFVKYAIPFVFRIVFTVRKKTMSQPLLLVLTEACVNHIISSDREMLDTEAILSVYGIIREEYKNVSKNELSKPILDMLQATSGEDVCTMLYAELGLEKSANLDLESLLDGYDSMHDRRVKELEASFTTEQISYIQENINHFPKYTERIRKQVLDAKRHVEWKKFVLNNFRDLTSLKQAQLFTDPVAEEDAPDYYTIVKYPKSLSGIRTAVKDDQIRTSEQLAHNIFLMLLNAIMYNGQRTPVAEMAMELLPFIDRFIRLVADTLQEDWSWLHTNVSELFSRFTTVRVPSPIGTGSLRKRQRS